jgi:hypothetical protein
MLSIAAFASTPYAMPSAPSTNCATKPIASSSTNSVVTKISSLGICDAAVNEARAPRSPLLATRVALAFNYVSYKSRVSAPRALA